MTLSRKLCPLAIGLGMGLGLTIAAPAQAVLVTTTIEGSVDLADASNPFGLTVGDTVTAVAIYDDTGIPALGTSDVLFNSGSGNSLTITFGSFEFEEEDDDAFLLTFPRLEFTNGAPSGLDFEIDGFSLPGFTDLTLGEFSSETRWFLDDNVGPVEVLLEGTWDFANAVTVPVDDPGPGPIAVSEPGSWMLLATGFAGLLGFARQRRRRESWS